MASAFWTGLTVDYRPNSSSCYFLKERGQEDCWVSGWEEGTKNFPAATAVADIFEPYAEAWVPYA